MFQRIKCFLAEKLKKDKLHDYKFYRNPKEEKKQLSSLKKIELLCVSGCCYIDMVCLDDPTIKSYWKCRCCGKISGVRHYKKNKIEAVL